MAHFIGQVQGSRGAVHRLGGKTTGMTTWASGWSFGVRVQLWHDEKTGLDYAEIYQTEGSGYSIKGETLALVLKEGVRPKKSKRYKR